MQLFALVKTKTATKCTWPLTAGTCCKQTLYCHQPLKKLVEDRTSTDALNSGHPGGENETGRYGTCKPTSCCAGRSDWPATL